MLVAKINGYLTKKMANKEKIENDVHLCNKCGREIPFGTFYYSICKNFEHFTKSENTNDDGDFYDEDGDVDTIEDEAEIEVEESIEIASLCKACGSYFNTESLETILKHLPVPGQEMRN